MLRDAMFLKMRAEDEELCPTEEPIILGKELSKKWVEKFRKFCHEKKGLLLPPKPLDVKEVFRL